MTQTFTPEGPTANIEYDYIPRRTDWMTNAGVRVWTQPMADLTPGRLAFSPNVVALARHPEVADREGAVEAVLEAHAERFHVFTERLELEAVAPVCVALRSGATPYGVPAALAHEAGKTAIDEITHADAAKALRRGMVGATPGFLAVLGATLGGLDTRRRVLASTVFTCVSETLITATLSQVPRDTRVREDVRATLREHAREEAFHHAMFGQLIGIVWPQMTAEEHDALGPLWARFITAFLASDPASEAAVLVSVGFDPVQAQRIVMEAAEIGRARMARAGAAAATLRFLAQDGVLDHDPTRRALEAEGLMS